MERSRTASGLRAETRIGQAWLSQAAFQAVWPRPRRAPEGILRIAHRQVERAGSVREAVARAAASGATMIELDVRTSIDGRPVVSHDAVVQVGRRVEWVAEATFEELAAMGHGVADPAEVFRAAAEAGLGAYVDIKSVTPGSCQALCSLLTASGLSRRSILASSRADLVALCAGVAPDLPRAVLFYDELDDPVRLAESAAADFVHPCWERFGDPAEHLSERWVRRVRARGLGVVTWHEERPAVLDYLCRLGVDGVCTDSPLLLADTVSSATRRLAGRAAPAQRS